MSDLILGIDGGGSKALVALADKSGRVLELSRSEGINPMDNRGWRPRFERHLKGFSIADGLAGIGAAMPAYGEVEHISADQRDEAYAFARKGKDKAEGIDWTLSELGNPLLSNATAIIECELWREYEGGDHAILVGAVKNLIVPEQEVVPMIYCRGKMGALHAFA